MSVDLLGRVPDWSPIVRNVHIVDGRLFTNACVDGAILNDVTVDGLQWRETLFVRDTRFRHVTLRGQLGRLSIHRGPLLFPRELTPAQKGAWASALADFYADVDWALDVRDAKLHELDIRPGAIPGRLVLRDPASSALVRREQAIAADLSTIDFGGSAFEILLEWLVESDADDVLLFAGGTRQIADLNAIHQLRERGIADPE